MDCIAHGVAKSWTQLSNFHFMVKLIWLFFALVVVSTNNDHLISFFPVFSFIFLAWRHLLQSAIWCWIEILPLCFLSHSYFSWCLLCQFKEDPSNLFQISRSFFHVHCWILLNPVYVKMILWYLSLICENFKYTNGFCIPRINLTWLQYVIITMCHWIQFANSFPGMFMKETGLLFFFLPVSMWGFDRKATLVPQNEFGHLFSFSTP